MEGTCLIAEMFKEITMDIDNLKDYYLSQYDSVTCHIEKSVPKYKYGILLDRYFFSLVNKVDEIITEEEKKEVDKILDTYETIEREGGLSISYSLKKGLDLEGYVVDPIVSRTKVSKLIDQIDILNSTTLMMLLIRYEEGIAGIYRYFLQRFPEAYLKDKVITYSDLISLSPDIDSVKNKLIQNEVEEFMRLPISDWYKIFEGRHKLTFGISEQEFEEFKEIYYRRNLAVHNQCIVNDVYLNNTKSEAKIGDVLKITKEYILQAIEKTEVLLYKSFWGVQKVANEAELNEELFNRGFNKMMEKDWGLSKQLFELLLQDKKQSESDFLTNKVNYWISQKNKEGIDSIRIDVEHFDVTSKKDTFVAAKYALLDEHTKVTEVLDRIIGSELPASYIEQWPLFIQYRNSEEYKPFKEKHKDLFEKQEYERSDESVDRGFENQIENECLGENGLNNSVCIDE